MMPQFKTGGLRGLYDYTVPPGFGDTFFMYAFNGDALTPGQNYYQQQIPILSGDFLARFWAGQETVCQGPIQIYDRWGYYWYAPPGVNFSSFSTGSMVLPERRYPDNNRIRFDLTNAQPTTAGTDGALTVYRSQLVFAGVRRRPNVESDPGPSPYIYREIPFSYAQRLPINRYASTGGVLNGPTTTLIPIQDYDFELRRIECRYVAEEGGSNATRFKMTLYDNEGYSTSNIPILGSRMLHFSNNNYSASEGQHNSFPNPPLLYRIGSNIKFDIWSLLFSPTFLPQTFDLLFNGVRRIPCL